MPAAVSNGKSKGGEMPREGSKRVSEIVVTYSCVAAANRKSILLEFSYSRRVERPTHYTPQKKKNWYFCEARKQTLENKNCCYIFALCVAQSMRSVFAAASATFESSSRANKASHSQHCV